MREAHFTLTLAVTVLAGCFYNSAWHQEKQSQRRQAEELAPERIESRGGPSWRSAETARVRVYASAAYRAEVTGWRDNVEELVARANDVTEDALRLRLTLEDAGELETPGTASLDQALTALEARDDGEDVDFVIGFVGSMSIVPQNIEQLGMARTHGKHLVLRATNDVATSDAIEEGLDQLSAEERHRLQRRRRSHMELAVFLHEIGHALGAIHVEDASAFMSPTYDVEMDHFAPQTLALMRPVVAHRRTPEEERDEAQLVETLLDVLRAAEDGYVAEERQWLMSALESGLSNASEAPTVEVAEHEGPLGDLRGLPEEERATYDLAKQAAERGQLDRAWELVGPLVVLRQDVYPVQELACHLSMRGVGGDEARRGCQRMMTLSTAQ